MERDRDRGAACRYTKKFHGIIRGNMIPSISSGQIRALLIVTLVIVVLIITIGASFLAKKDIDTGVQDPAEGLTPEEKIKLLEDLSAPRDAGELTDAEKRAVLESLSAPRDAGELTDEEKKATLDGLTAPRQ